MRELKKNINEGTEMGEIGNVQIDQFAGPDGLMVQLLPPMVKDMCKWINLMQKLHNV